MLAGGALDEEDKEAYAVWESVDERMDERRREKREAKLKEEIERFRAENPKISEQFADLKRKLAGLAQVWWGGGGGGGARARASAKLSKQCAVLRAPAGLPAGLPGGLGAGWGH